MAAVQEAQSGTPERYGTKVARIGRTLYTGVQATVGLRGSSNLSHGKDRRRVKSKV